LLGFHQAALTFAHRDWDTLPPAKRPDAHLAVVKIVGKHPAVVREAAPDRKRIARVGVGPVGIGYLGNSLHGHLRRKLKALSGFVIDDLADAILAKRAVVPRLSADPAARLVGALQGRKQRLALLLGGQEFDLSGGLQGNLSILEDHSVPV